MVPGDELRCVVEYESTGTSLHLISFHAYRGLYDAERTAHELALGDAAVLIGCERSADVPEPLRRIADLVLTFPRIDRGRFARIFERVFRAKPTPGWDAPGADWTRYLVPADFHAPRRLDSARTRRWRTSRRRRDSPQSVTPDIGPRLSELHGLGEARQICEDLVADIRAAQAGRIPWTAVDRGLLLVGAPGTGKTTLARALAKECGIKFVVASAAGWQSAGYLDSHLRAMRADFTEARRYAPAILFIDELDSIGSREQLGGDKRPVPHRGDQRASRADPGDQHRRSGDRDRGDQLPREGRSCAAAGRTARPGRPATTPQHREPGADLRLLPRALPSPNRSRGASRRERWPS